VDCLDAVVTSPRYRSVQRQRLSRLHSAASHRCIQQLRVRLGRHLQAGCVLGAMMVTWSASSLPGVPIHWPTSSRRHPRRPAPPTGAAGQRPTE